MNKLTKEEKKLVCDALRSGEYKQGQTVLCRWAGDEWRMCAIGVAADVLCDSYWVRDKFDPTEYRLADQACQERMYQIFGSAVWGMNDRGVPFDSIADWIETNL